MTVHNILEEEVINQLWQLTKLGLVHHGELGSLENIREVNEECIVK